MDEICPICCVATGSGRETTLERGPLSSLGIEASWSRLAMFAGAGLLALLGLVTDIAGILVLRLTSLTSLTRLTT